MSTIIYELVIVMTFGTNPPLEAVEGNYTDFSVCESVGRRQVAAMKKEDPRNFLGKVSFECRSSGTVTGKKISVITKREPWR